MHDVAGRSAIRDDVGAPDWLARFLFGLFGELGFLGRELLLVVPGVLGSQILVTIERGDVVGVLERLWIRASVAS
jgi:hypothetical protein